MYRSRKEALRSLGKLEEEDGKKRRKSGAAKASAKKKQKDDEKKEKATASKKSPTKSKSPAKSPKYPIGTSISKIFQDPADGIEKPFQGKVTKFNSKDGMYYVSYEDGDGEEMSEGEVGEYLASTAAKKSNGKKENGTAAKKSNENKEANIFRVGSKVSKEMYDPEFEMERPIDGSVTSFDSKTGKYTVTYENDTSEHLEEEEVATIFVPKFERGKVKVSKEGMAGMVGKFSIKEKKYDVHWGKLKSSFLSEGEIEDLLNGKEKKKNKAAADTTDEEESSGTPEQEITTGKRRSAAKKVNYRIDESDEEEFTDDDEKPKAKKKTKKAVKKSKGKKKNDSDSDDFAPGEESDDDELMNDAGPTSSDEEEFVAKKPTKKKAAESTAKAKKEPKPEHEGRTKMSDVEGIKKTLKNNPDYFKLTRDEIKATQSFLDPCGMEATDDIIDRLVGHQLDRILNLFSLALKGDALGSKSNPLVLGTACSGTDAPALALMLNQEQLEARGMGGLFKYEHVFSCEKEPYKQAYLARK